MAKSTTQPTFFLENEFKEWLKDIGLSNASITQYPSNIKVADSKQLLTQVTTIHGAIQVSKSLLNLLGKKPKTKYISNMSSALQMYIRFLNYIPSKGMVTYMYNGINKLKYVLAANKTSLAECMISNTYFINTDAVRKRANDLAQAINNSHKIPARFSTATVYSFNGNSPLIKFSSRTNAKSGPRGRVPGSRTTPPFFYPGNTRKNEKGRDTQHTDNGEPQAVQELSPRPEYKE